ncbi:MAG TPA: o-succinylbenzoate synthase [Longimicrobiales bacterium]|nr:o-succinylbenzoate synthase [Longimicrobiales bacterium]
MRLERAVLREVPLELREPFDTSHGRVHVRRVLLLTLHGEGLEGWGECVAASEPSYTAETADTAWHVLTDFVLPRVIGGEIGSVGVPARGTAASGLAASAPTDALLEPVRWIRGHPMALATVEMAAWDLGARAAGVSLARGLGGERTRVSVGISLGLKPSADELAEAVARALEEGYARVKLKIAPGRDIELLAAIRERFGSAALSADANCAYVLADAPRLRELDALDLQMLEQPLARDDLVDHARLQEQLSTPICLDESIESERDAAAALELESCRVVNLKPGRVGGFTASRRIHDTLLTAQMPIWCGGMLETGIGRAHNLALASLPGFTLPGDISASGRYWARDIVSPEHDVVDGYMRVPSGPGIGVEVDVERIDALTVRIATFG